MPVQWTVHVPQAMQRHGSSAKPQATANCDEAMTRLFQSIRAPEVKIQYDERATAQPR